MSRHSLAAAAHINPVFTPKGEAPVPVIEGVPRVTTPSQGPVQATVTGKAGAPAQAELIRILPDLQRVVLTGEESLRVGEPYRLCVSGGLTLSLVCESAASGVSVMRLRTEEPPKVNTVRVLRRDTDRFAADIPCAVKDGLGQTHDGVIAETSTGGMTVTTDAALVVGEEVEIAGKALTVMRRTPRGYAFAFTSLDG